MSLQELKTRHTQQINQLQDEALLQQIVDFTEQITTYPNTLTEAELAAALEGRAQIERGEFVTFDQFKKELSASIREVEVRLAK